MGKLVDWLTNLPICPFTKSLCTNRHRVPAM
jgi:hypothetical protein